MNILSAIKLYFILGLAMLMIVLWDYKQLKQTARHVIRQDENATGFSRIIQEIRNMIFMSAFAFFLWPIVLYWEITGAKEK